MLLSLRRHWLVCLSLIPILTAMAAGTSASVTNFVLYDQHGDAHELYYHGDAQAVVLLSHSSRAGDSEQLIAKAAELSNQWADQDVEVFLLNVDPRDDRDRLQKLDTSLPIMVDEAQLVAEALEFRAVGEAVILNPADWEAVYRGPVAGMSSALDQHLQGEAATQIEHPMPADATRLATLSDSSDSVASYSDTIAPLLIEKCVACHREGGIGPWAMTEHIMVKGFAPMIKEVVLTKRMPPWHADPHINQFRDDISLSTEQKRTLINWIDAGAPRGEGEDPLANLEPPNTDWIRGEPDLVVELPAFDVPATGVVDYQYFEVLNPYPDDVWVEAVQIIPGDRQVLHHAIATFGEPQNPDDPIRPAEAGDEGNSLLQQQLMTFVPGNEHYIYPDETGLQVPKGTSFFVQMHYTTSGKATRDKSLLGLYFRDDAPEHILKHHTIVNPAISIPPQEAAHEEAAYYQFPHDAVIYSLFPHAHYRGASSEFAVRYPDGEEQLVLSVPHYDFNWQRYFRLAEPLEVPAGTQLIHRTTYDNSARNETNPDPSRTVPWGLQSWDEMLYGGVSYRFKDPELNTQKGDRLQFRADLMMGYMDGNMDGTLELSEMPEETRKSLESMVPWFDANRNGGLENDELTRLFVKARERRREQAAAASNSDQ